MYQNTTDGIVLNGVGCKAINNTIYQAGGPALLVQSR